MKNIILGAVAVVITIVGVSLAGKPTVNVTTPAPIVNVDVPEQKTPVVNVQAPDVRIPATVVNVPKQESPTLGAFPGGDIFQAVTLNDELTNGLVISTSTSVSLTGAASDFKCGSSVTFSLVNSAETFTMPASTSLRNFLPKRGQTCFIRYVNATTTLGSNLTLAPGAGVSLRGVNGTSTIAFPNRSLLVQFYRSATTTPLGDITGLVIPE